MTVNLTLRSTKGSPLTIAEMDGNLTALKNESESASAAAAAAQAEVDALETTVAGKQNALIAGANVSIDPDTNVISASSNSLSTIASTGITDATATGRSVLTGTAAAGRTALGLGSAATQSTSAFAAAGHVVDTANPHAVTKTQVGLSNVDNTSDASKPLSTAAVAALALKVDASRTVNGKALTSDVSLSKSDIGLGNADNTSDVNKPVSVATQAALDTKVPTSAIVNNLVAGGATVPLSAEMGKALQEAKQDKLTAGTNITIGVDGTISANGDLATVASSGITDAGVTGVLVLQAATQADARTALALGSAATSNSTDFAAASHATNTSNPHSVTKSQVGLGNADNTSDANKPVSIAQQAALDAKVPLTRTINGFALSANVTLGKGDIGLGNVDNTSDANKPISTATQAALDAHTAALGTKQARSALNVPAMLDDMATVTPVTVTAVTQALANNEFATQAAMAAGGTDGSDDWGLHQNKFVRMRSGACFAVAAINATSTDTTSSVGDIALYRWGPTYPGASAPTLVKTIPKASTSTKDRDFHLLRNAKLDQVHLIVSRRANWNGTTGSDSNSDTYRIFTFDASGTELDQTNVPKAVPGGLSNDGWFVPSMSTAYSTCGISDDGLICFANSISFGTYNGVTATEMSSFKRYQFWQWNGGSWSFSPLKTKSSGMRISYERIYVDPPGRRGYVIGVGGTNVKTNDYNAVYNPNYIANPSAFPNITANSTYNGSGRFASIVSWEVPLDGVFDTYTVSNLITQVPRTTDLSSSSPNGAEYKAFYLHDVFMDQRGRIFIATVEGDGSTTEVRCVTLINAATKAQISRVTNAVGSGYNLFGFHEEMSGRVWVGCMVNGVTVDARLLPCDVASDGTLTVQAIGSALSQANTPWCKDWSQATPQYHGIQPAGAFLPSYRNGSMQSNNWIDMMLLVYPNYTGTAPGNTRVDPTFNTLRVKRVRVQIPAQA